jgi:hypothetical protein
MFKGGDGLPGHGVAAEVCHGGYVSCRRILPSRQIGVPRNGYRAMKLVPTNAHGTCQRASPSTSVLETVNTSRLINTALPKRALAGTCPL